MISIILKRYKNIVIVEPLELCNDEALTGENHYDYGAITITARHESALLTGNLILPTSGDLHAMAYTCNGKKSAKQLYRNIKHAVEEYNANCCEIINYVSTEFESDDTKVVTISTPDIFCVRLVRVGCIILMNVLKFDNICDLKEGDTHGNVYIGENDAVGCICERICLSLERNEDPAKGAFSTASNAEIRYDQMIRIFEVFARSLYLTSKNQTANGDFNTIKQGFDECCILGV